MRLLTAGSLVRARQGEPKIPKSCIVTSGFFHRGIIPLMTAIFSCLRCKKIAVTPLDESGRCYAAVRFYIFFILWVIVKYPTMSLAFSFGSKQRFCDLASCTAVNWLVPLRCRWQIQQRARAGKNKEQCEALQASSATMFLTARVVGLYKSNFKVMYCDFGIFS